MRLSIVFIYFSSILFFQFCELYAHVFFCTPLPIIFIYAVYNVQKFIYLCWQGSQTFPL